MVKKKRLADTLSGDWKSIETTLPAIAKAYQNIIDRLASSHAGSTSPRTGDLLPPFQLPDDRGQLVSSADLLTRGPLVVSMNRGKWCSFCRYELKALQESSKRIADLGGSIVAISPDTRTYANKLRDEHGIEFPVLCDVDNGYALSLGLAVWLGDEIKPLFAEIGLDLAVFQSNPAWIVPIPATYVVGTNGRIVESFVDPDYRKRIEPDHIIAALAAL